MPSHIRREEETGESFLLFVYVIEKLFPVSAQEKKHLRCLPALRKYAAALA